MGRVVVYFALLVSLLMRGGIAAAAVLQVYLTSRSSRRTAQVTATSIRETKHAHPVDKRRDRGRLREELRAGLDAAPRVLVVVEAKRILERRLDVDARVVRQRLERRVGRVRRVLCVFLLEEGVEPRREAWCWLLSAKPMHSQLTSGPPVRTDIMADTTVSSGEGGRPTFARHSDVSYHNETFVAYQRQAGGWPGLPEHCPREPGAQECSGRQTEARGR